MNDPTTTRWAGPRAGRIAVAITVGALTLAGAALVSHADPYRSRALETGASQDLAITPAPVWPTIASTCTLDAACNVSLTAGTGTVSVQDAVHGPANVPFYGFGVNGAAPALAGAPGSVIKVPVGTTIHLTVDNQLGQGLDLSFPSLSHVTKTPGGYDVVADRVGTMVFQPGTNPEAPRQVAMGLVGVLVVTPVVAATDVDPAADCTACAYDTAHTYQDEAVVAMTDLDLEFAQHPFDFDMSYFGQPRDAQQATRRVYHLINGQAFPDTDVIDVRAGDSLLLRYVNAGVSDKNMGLLGVRQTLIARNASPYVDAQALVAPLVGPGETADVVVAVPASAVAGQKYSLMDQGRQMNNGTSEGFGGALTFVNVWAGIEPTTTTTDPNATTTTDPNATTTTDPNATTTTDPNATTTTDPNATTTTA